MKIDSLEQWARLSSKLAEEGYMLWQWQSKYDEPEGFHAHFGASGKPDIEVITFSKEVQEAIVNYR